MGKRGFAQLIRKLREVGNGAIRRCLARSFEQKGNLTLGDTLYTVVQNGHAFKAPAEAIVIHEQWFKDLNWTWNASVVPKVVGEDMAMALVRYSYQANKDSEPFETWLVHVSQLQEGAWRIVHDQNTAPDSHAFALAAGIE